MCCLLQIFVFALQKYNESLNSLLYCHEFNTLKHTITDGTKSPKKGFSAAIEPGKCPSRMRYRTEIFSVDAIIMMKVAFIGLYIYKTT
jgi:hypothetical protein